LPYRSRLNWQPEFTQIDMEMSFCSEDDIFDISERLMQKIFKEAIGYDLTIPFKRMSYQDAMAKHKSDKPDIRESKEGFGFVWIVGFPLLKYNEEEKRWEIQSLLLYSLNPRVSR